MSKQGEFIKNARRKCGFTQKQLADKLNVSDKVISKWEVGDSFPDYTLLPQLSSILQVDIQEILNGEYKEKSETVAETKEVIYVERKQTEKPKTFKDKVINILSFMKKYQNYFFLGFYIISFMFLFLPVIKWAFPAWQFSDNFFKFLSVPFKKDATKHLLGENLSAMFTSAEKNINTISWIMSIVAWIYIIFLLIVIVKVIINTIKKQKYNNNRALLHSIIISALSIVSFIIAKIIISKINGILTDSGMDMTVYKNNGLQIKTALIWCVLWSFIAVIFSVLFKYLKCLKTSMESNTAIGDGENHNNKSEKKSSAINEKTKQKIKLATKICVIILLVVGLSVGGGFGISAIIKKNTPSPQNTWNDFVGCINNSRYNDTKDYIYYLSDEQKENYQSYSDSYVTYSNLSTSSFKKIEGDENYAICEVILNSTMIVAGVRTNPVYKYNVYFVRNVENKWKLLSPLNIALGNDNNYQIDKTNKLIYSDLYSIKSAIFYYGSHYENMNLPDDIESISGSFYAHLSSLNTNNVRISSANLKSLTIPDTIKTIGNKTFFNYSNISELSLPKSLKVIGDFAFSGCSSLASIIIPNGVTSIGESAFSGCNSLISITMLNGLKNIGKSAFENCSGLTSVIIPDGVTKIGDLTFSGCSSLTSITIPESVTSIGASAFSGCSILGSITIPNGVENIGKSAFENCSGLISLIIPESVKTIGDYAFSGCTHISKLTLSEGIVDIGNFAFQNLIVTEIVVPDSVTAIGEGAFKGCNNLNDLTLPFVGGGDHKTYWYDKSSSVLFGYIFGCSANTVYTNGPFDYPNNTSTLTYQGQWSHSKTEIDNSVRYYFTMYYIPQSLRSVTITNETKLYENAFYGCDYLTSIKLNKEIYKIGESAFKKCSGLTNFTMPESVTNIDYSAFGYCDGLNAVHISNLESWLKISFEDYDSNPLYFAHHLYLNGVELTEIVIPDSVTEIKDCAFSGASSLTSITISNDITNIGDHVFFGCSGLETITLPDSVISIGEYVFSNCSGLTTITIPNNVTSIGEYAFSECSGLISISIPESVTSIGEYAFKNCSGLKEVHISNLESWLKISFDGYDSNPLYFARHLYLNGVELTKIVIPDSVTEIKECAFSGASSLTTITIPNNVTSIGEYAFSECSGLTSISIPESVTNIDYSAFGYCDGLNAVHISNLESWLKISFEDYGSNPLYFAHHLYLNGVELTEIVIPDSVTEIKDCAFSGASSLTSIIIPDGVTSIGNSSFSDCSSLTTITIPNGVTKIGFTAFLGCRNLTSINIPNSVTSIGSSAFENCDNLTSIIISKAVTYIGSWAFNSCKNLTIYCEEASQPSGWDSDWNLWVCPVYWYSETQPTKEGKYWHYDEDGETILIW